MRPSTIIDFLCDRGLGDSVVYADNEEIQGVSVFETAEKGCLSWLLPERADRASSFRGSMLLNNRFAFMKVLEKFFAPEPTRQHIRGPGIGGSGFTFEWDGEHYMRWPHVGGVQIHEDVEIGRFVAIDRGSLGDTIIRRGVRIDNLVHIAHNCDIGEHTLIVAGSVICGSVKIGRNCYIGARSVIRHRLTIGDNVIIGMGSVVTKDVPSGECWMGNPARFYRRSDEVPRP